MNGDLWYPMDSTCGTLRVLAPHFENRWSVAVHIATWCCREFQANTDRSTTTFRYEYCVWVLFFFLVTVFSESKFSEFVTRALACSAK
jgi:hypothetical protein